jgi:predicted small secreted protein
MKKQFLALLAALTVLTSCGIVSGTGLDAASLANAAGTAMTALSITDDQIAELSAQSVAYMDSVNKVEEGA